MTSNAARLEALGEPEVRFVWRNHDLTIRRALEEWPIDQIRHGCYVDAVVILLDGQTAPVPHYGDVTDLADAMATAVGVTRVPEAPAPDRDHIFGTFGAVPQLLWALDTYEDDIASDLKRFWGVDYLDRWRGDLTLRQIWTYIRRSQPTSALAVAQNGGHELWTKQAIVTAQVWEQLAREVYVGRPMTREEMDASLARQRANEKTMSTLSDKEDYYSPEASRARWEAAQQRKAAAAVSAAHGAEDTAAPNDPAPPILSAMDKAMAARRRDMTTSRKAG